MGKRNGWRLGMLALLLTALLCGCRSVSLPSGETFVVVREQQTPSVSNAVTAEKTPTTEIEGDYYFVQQQDESTRRVFSLIYQGIQNFETRISLPEGTTRAQVEIVDELLYKDCPELFYLSHLSTYFYRQSAPDLITEIEVSYNMTCEEAQEAEQRIEELLQQWLQETDGLTDYEKELYVHDEIIANCTYDNEAEYSGSIYGALVLGRARCQGYANAMTYVLRRMGIECLYLYGEATNDAGKESHAWNAVRIDGVWVLVDATWDDPVGERETLTHAYFNLNDELMSISHVPDPNALGEVPCCDSLQWNYCVQQGSFVREDEKAIDSMTAYMIELLHQREESAAIQFATHEQCQQVLDALQSILQVAADETGVYPTSTSYSVDNNVNYLDIRSICYD